MILKILISTIGFWIINRSLQRVWHQFGFLTRHLCFVQAVFALVIVLFGALTPENILLHWLFIGIVLATLKFFPPFLLIFLKRELQKALICWLDAVVISLQSGISLRMSAVHAAENFEGWRQNIFVDLAHAIAFSEKNISTKWPLVAAFTERVIEIERSGIQCVEQIKSMRKELAMMENFRRRSGQVSMQIRMQAIIVTFLYVGLLFFVAHMFGFYKNIHIIGTSTALFLLGLIWIFLVGRRMNWKT